jgi:hypothetical protein
MRRLKLLTAKDAKKTFWEERLAGLLVRYGG